MYNPYDDPYGGGDSPGGHHIHVEYKRNNIFKRKKAGSATINAGGAIIIIIFVVLCLTIFGLLSFTTAFADKKLADRTLKNVQEYYIADTRAELMLEAVYTAIYNTGDVSGAAAAFIGPAAETSDLEAELEIWETEFAGMEALAVAYQTQMNDVQALYSEIIFYYNNGKLSYRISKWNIILTAEFDYGGRGENVWDGGFEDWD